MSLPDTTPPPSDKPDKPDKPAPKPKPKDKVVEPGSDDWTVTFEGLEDTDSLKKELAAQRKEIMKMKRESDTKNKTLIIAELKELKVKTKDFDKQSVESLQFYLDQKKAEGKTRKIGTGKDGLPEIKTGTGYLNRLTGKWENS